MGAMSWARRVGAGVAVASALVIGMGISPAQALDLPVVGDLGDSHPITERPGSLTFQTGSPSIPVYNANGESWTVINKITGAGPWTGTVSGNLARPTGLAVGLYTLSVANATGTTTAEFLIVGETPAAEPFYGVQTHFAFPEGVHAWSHPDVTLHDLTAIGFSSIRDEVYWHNTEKVDNVYQLRAKDLAYQAKAADLGLDRLFTADYGNPYVQPGLGVCDPAVDPTPCQRAPQTTVEQERFAKYALAVIDTIDAKRVELWNDFNHEQFNHWCKTGTCYAQKMGPIAKRIKDEKGSDVQVIGGGISGADVDWFEDFYAEADRLGYLDSFDAVSYHP